MALIEQLEENLWWRCRTLKCCHAHQDSIFTWEVFYL